MHSCRRGTDPPPQSLPLPAEPHHTQKPPPYVRIRVLIGVATTQAGAKGMYTEKDVDSVHRTAVNLFDKGSGV